MKTKSSKSQDLSSKGSSQDDPIVDEGKEELRNIPRGVPKSGRTWKTVRNQRYSEIKKDKPLKSTWDQKMSEKNLKKMVKLKEKELKAARTKELEEKRKRQEENKQRRLENERKAEIVQPIKNTAKLKRMKKKQLRAIEKR